MSGLILSAWAGDTIPGFVTRVVANHEYFAKRHGYSHRFVVDPTGRKLGGNGVYPEWLKVPAIAEALDDGFPWVLWIDTDSVFSDPEESLADLLAFNKDIVVTGDSADMCNTGHVLLKNTPQVRQLVEWWWAMRLFVFPPVNTTHVDDRGRLLDQPALNYLFAGGQPNQQAVTETGQHIFNTVNGFPDNPDRRHRFFQFTHAPTRGWRMPMTMSLLSPEMRKLVAIVPQGRLNGYPRRLAGSPRSIKSAPIMHYPGRMRKYLKAELDRLESLPGGTT